MNEQQKEFVRSKVLQFLNGNTPEKNKLEFKRKWYDLKDKQGKDYNEFLKDTCGIVNSYGGDDGYIIVGVSESPLELLDTKIEDSGRNQSEIKDLIIANIADRFVIDIDYVEVSGKQLSVIYIPPSTNKPHIILKYQTQKKSKQDNNTHENQIFENEIFIRNGSGGGVATKADLDRMYWERGNILLNEKLMITLDFGIRSIHYKYSMDNIYWNIKCVFENQGLRPVPVFQLGLKIEIAPKNDEFESFVVIIYSSIRDADTPIVVNQNMVIVRTISFSTFKSIEKLVPQSFRNIDFNYKLMHVSAFGRNGKEINCEYYMI